MIFPNFKLSSENITDKIEKILHKYKIYFKSNLFFSKIYSLFPQDNEKIRNVFGEKLLDLLETKKDISIECKDNVLVYYLSSERRKPNEIRMFIEEGEKIQGSGSNL